MKENPKSEAPNPKQIRMTKIQNPKRDQDRRQRFGHSSIWVLNLFRIARTTRGNRKLPDFEFRISALGAALVVVLLAGCAVQPQKLQICPGKATVTEALQTLAARAEHAVPMGASGRAVLTYHEPERKKPEKHALEVMLRFEPPTDLYLQGSVTAVPKAVIMGSNHEQFWLVLRPKEISSYYLGEWQNVHDFEGLVLSPRVMLESVGLVMVPGSAPNPARWKLANKGPYDILTQHDENGRLVKRLYIYACDYTVRKIEYFDPRGKVVAIAQLDTYQPVVEGFDVPTQIDVVSTRPDGQKDSVALAIHTVKTMKFNEKQREVLFQPPRDANKFEHIYHFQDGRWAEE